MSEDAILRADEVTREFGDVTVVDGVSLELEPGTLYGLVGPNGSGKTTLIQVLAGILAASDGSVAYEGPETDRPIGYMQQRPSFRQSFAAEETLEFYTALVDDDPAGLLERVGIRDAADRQVGALSGGMTRLLGLAQATVGDPPVILLDEPGSGLDPGMRRRTIEVADALANDGAAVLFTSHDLDLVADWCDHVFLLDRGEISIEGSPDTLLADNDAGDLREVFDTIVEQDEQLTVMGVSE
jgi:ABC-type multidrug transport system ATPase subunit